MKTVADKGAIKTITTHYIDGAFVESHGQEVMDILRPTDGQLIGRVTLGDEDDTRRAIGAARRAFATFGRTTKEERASTLRRLHQAVSARVDDLTAAMVAEYGGVVQFARPIVETGVNAFLAAEKGLQELPMTESWGETTVTLEPVGVAGLITAWNANALFICLKLASAVAAGCTVVLKPSELSSPIAREEIFGPVLCVIAYDSEDEAIRIANDSQYGLHAAVLGTDLPRARRVASQIRSGRVVINGMTDDPQAPWGGFKYSGVGREYGRYGIEAFLETRAILES